MDNHHRDDAADGLGCDNTSDRTGVVGGPAHSETQSRVSFNGTDKSHSCAASVTNATGTIGILHAVVVGSEEPMRMIDLGDRAAQFGISRNQIGVMIHSGRAACLFMRDGGIVGLIGRDEAADPSQFETARSAATPRVRVGPYSPP